MHIRDIFRDHRTTFSFEFFPPKTDAASDELFVRIAELQELQPSFVSVTYGAGGTTRDRTHDLVVRIQKETNLTAVSHLTCVCHSLPEMEHILDRYAAAGIENVLALGGDPPKDKMPYDRSKDAFQYADQLVAFVRSRKTADGRGFGVGVAGFPEGHPSTPNRLVEMDNLKKKIDAGADYICTQLFFDNRDFYDFRDRCDQAGIKVPIVAGIMPITDLSQIERFTQRCGATIPKRLHDILAPHREDPAKVESLSIDYAIGQCRELLDRGAPGVHFYTLNRSRATRDILTALRKS
jgi:methylenetetrahydrofolate reductase (NADPH)